MRFSKILLLFIFLLSVSKVITAQDYHFSQFYNSPLTLNPALTGLFLEDMRIGVQYRNQWNTVTEPFQTMAASADFSILKNGIIGDDFVGVGLLLANDVAGDARFRNTQTQLSLSYNKTLSSYANQYLSAGLQIGAAQRGVNLNSLLFDSQFNGSTLDPNLPSGENIDRNIFTHLDLAAGIAWFYAPEPRTSFYIGTSMFHLNAPNVSFYTDFEEPLDRKFILHAGAQFPISSSISLIPRAVIINQGPFSEFNFGGLIKFEVHPDYGTNYGQAAFYIGTMHRVNDAQIVIARFDFDNIGISASYDINISELSNASRGNGGFELALIYKSYLFDTPGNSGPQGCPVW